MYINLSEVSTIIIRVELCLMVKLLKWVSFPHFNSFWEFPLDNMHQHKEPQLHTVFINLPLIYVCLDWWLSQDFTHKFLPHEIILCYFEKVNTKLLITHWLSGCSSITGNTLIDHPWRLTVDTFIATSLDLWPLYPCSIKT